MVNTLLLTSITWQGLLLVLIPQVSSWFECQTHGSVFPFPVKERNIVSTMYHSRTFKKLLVHVFLPLPPPQEEKSHELQNVNTSAFLLVAHFCFHFLGLVNFTRAKPMKFGKNNSFCSFALGSAHVKFDI